jgi:cytidylate kinase
MPEVRKALLHFQRSFPKPPGAVLDGRDIGTEIFPNAFAKFFLTASPEARAARYQKRQLEKGEKIEFNDALSEINARDKRDSGRAVAPMKPAADAVVIDSTHLNADEVFDVVRLSLMGTSLIRWG